MASFRIQDLKLIVESFCLHYDSKEKWWIEDDSHVLVAFLDSTRDPREFMNAILKHIGAMMTF